MRLQHALTIQTRAYSHNQGVIVFINQNTIFVCFGTTFEGLTVIVSPFAFFLFRFFLNNLLLSNIHCILSNSSTFSISFQNLFKKNP